jgi:hypothetical protein
MNTLLASPEREILQAACDASSKWGLSWQVLKPGRRRAPRADTGLRLRYGTSVTDYVVEIKQGLRPDMLGTVQYQLKRLGARALLVANYISPPLAEALRAREIQFIDTAGNAFLQAAPLLVWIRGERLSKAGLLHQAEGTGRVFQPSGLQIIFALLCQPELITQPYREIAAQTGVAHGTVGWVIPEMIRLNFAAIIQGTRRLLNAELLLKQWVEAYLRTMRPKLLLGRFHAKRLTWTTELQAQAYGLVLGGEPAAQRLTRYLQPGTATFYGAGIEPKLILKQQLRPDPQGNIEFLRRFWHFETEEQGVAPLLLVYADLLATGDARCLETAGLLYDRIIARFK